ncbi:MAG: sigma-70 family RNA polymerase sigma factor [Defluviitaleaceae bacterium]|nr:sigma-70 family RNA polymerase sigma factor [Defluviitaleaceae bacterium]
MTKDEKDIKRKERLDELMAKYPSIDRKKHLEDLHICKNYMSGDTDTFMKLYEYSCRKTRRYVYRNSGNKLFNLQDKEDIMAETESIAIMKIHMFHGWSRYSTWMMGIARNRILTFVKKKLSTDKPIEYTENIHNPEIINTPIALWESNQYVSELLGGLSIEEQSIVTDVVFDQRSFKSIASENNVATSIVIVQYEKAIEKLREIVQAEKS